jgi:protein phosphatase
MDFSYITSAALSDTGRKRKSNEDAILVLPEAGVYCVADGMGGAAGGELASRWTVEAVRRAFLAGAESSRKTAQVREALNSASRRIKLMADEQAIIGAGTTVVVLFFDDYRPDQATILHAGDSRAYRIRDGVLECLTQDHSLAASAGLTHERSLPTMFRGVITRAIGLDDTVELDEAVIQVKAGDCFLLCSDGLTRMLTDSEIQSLIHQTTLNDLDRLGAALVAETNRAGGEDNISVVLARVGPLPAGKPRASEPAGANSPDKTETAELAVIADQAAPPGQPGPAAPTPSSDSPRPVETEDVFVGVTPQSGQSNTGGGSAGSPTARTVELHPPRLAKSVGAFGLLTGKRARSGIGPYLLGILALLAALAAAYYCARHYFNFPPAKTEPGPTPGGLPTVTVDAWIASRVPTAEHAAAWKMEWSRALQHSFYSANVLVKYRDVITALFATLNVPALPPAAAEPAGLTAGQRAENYCSRLFDLNQHLQTQVKAFAAERAAELAVFGAAPAAMLQILQRFAEQTEPPAADPTESLRHDLELLTNWLAEGDDRMIALEEIRSGPPSLLPGILEQRNELWNGVLATIENCGPAIEKRQAAGGDDPLLNNLAALRSVILKNAQASRERKDALSWPAKENLPTLEGFFQRVKQYQERAPEPAPAAPANS